MGAYGEMDQAIAGLKYGIGSGEEVCTRRAAEQIGFGVPVFGYAGNNVDCYLPARDTLILTFSADLIAANVTTLTLSAVVKGVTQAETVAETFDTDHDTTMDNLVSAIETAYPNATVTLTDAINNRQITIFQPGTNWTGSGVVTLGVSQATITATYTTAQVFIGITIFTQVACYITTRGYYVENDAVNVMEEGEVWVNTSGAVSANTDAYVIWLPTVPADQGKFTGTSTNNYVTNCKFKSTTTGAGLAIVEVRGQNTDATP